MTDEGQEVNGVTLRTRRLLLRPLTEADDDLLEALYGDTEVARFIGGNALDVRVQLEHFAEIWRTCGFGQSAAIDLATGDFLGRIGLHWWPEWSEVEVGYVLRRSAWGHGLASEGAARWLTWAFDHLDIDRVTAVIHPDNDRSQRVARRLGMRFDREDRTASGIRVHVFRKDLTPRRSPGD